MNHRAFYYMVYTILYANILTCKNFNKYSDLAKREISQPPGGCEISGAAGRAKVM